MRKGFLVILSEATGPSGYIGDKCNSRINMELNKWGQCYAYDMFIHYIRITFTSGYNLI